MCGCAAHNAEIFAAMEGGAKPEELAENVFLCDLCRGQALLKACLELREKRYIICPNCVRYLESALGVKEEEKQ